MVRRIFVEKKADYAVHAAELSQELAEYLGIVTNGIRILVRYDVENISDSTFEAAKNTVFSEPPVDTVYEEQFPHGADDFVFTVEFLPGQYDQRADSAQQCVRLLCPSEHPEIQTATVYVVSGTLTPEQRQAIQRHCVNPVDSHLASDDKSSTLALQHGEAPDVQVFDGFTEMDATALRKFYDSLGLAMTFADMKHIQYYFAVEERRNPTMTEIRVLDTYWSDHCRHTTFATELTDVEFEEGPYKELMKKTFESYRWAHEELYPHRSDKYTCLMDLGTIAAKQLKRMGYLDDLEPSDEINACSIVVPLVVDGHEEEWLVNFKNETHNHPTEIEPFGGAATCLGGCIRDPLSGRTYVYQAMRVTGAADPTRPLSETLEGKLPQRKIVTTAAHGYSSYGNQIGLATGHVCEIYHPGYVAKRMEVGAVIAAAPRRAVKRLSSEPGDVIILIGGRTGRDGCGGATGASKAHDTSSLSSCGAEVQKGNAPTERKIQRLFRREEVSALIKKCNDFGAGGVSVAIGELADGLLIDLDKVPKKYAGLDGTEIAISESQERMAVVVAPADADQMLRYAAEENLEAVAVATVTEEPRMIITWRGKEIVNLSRRFIDTNGAHQSTKVIVEAPKGKRPISLPIDRNERLRDNYLRIMSDLNVCSQKGLVEMFDSSVGAGSVTMPFGGRYQLTPTQCMVGKIPTRGGECDAVTIMSHGFDPYISSWSPFHGAIDAVMQSVAKVVAAGGDATKIRLSFQEYFQRLGNDPRRWGQPLAALLGAYHAQMGLKLPAIGGKDSMSGSFNDIDVPPTLISFAVCVSDVKHTITPEFKNSYSRLTLLSLKRNDDGTPDYAYAMRLYAYFHKLVEGGHILSAYALGYGGIAEALAKCSFGNKICFNHIRLADFDSLGTPRYGDILFEDRSEITFDKEFRDNFIEVGNTIGHDSQFYPVDAGSDYDIIMYKDMFEAWSKPLEGVYPSTSGRQQPDSLPEVEDYHCKAPYICKHKVAKPQVFIPVFPGTNCEYDSAEAFRRAGADATTLVFRNQNSSQIQQSVEAFAQAIAQSQIVMIPGGFSAGDEPDGSAKFITSVFRNPLIAEQVMKLLHQRDGLMLGICNGFQALIKLGLVPYGEIRQQSADSPTLTFNTIGRHQSMMAATRLVSNLSPWLQQAYFDTDYMVPISHGEGRFVAPQQWLDKLFANGQVATRYVDLDGKATMQEPCNMNGSYMAVEGITSPDGRVFGKMAHSERRSVCNKINPQAYECYERGSFLASPAVTNKSAYDLTALNIPGPKDQRIFESGVQYFL